MHKRPDFCASFVAHADWFLAPPYPVKIVEDGLLLTGHSSACSLRSELIAAALLATSGRLEGQPLDLTAAVSDKNDGTMGIRLSDESGRRMEARQR